MYRVNRDVAAKHLLLLVPSSVVRQHPRAAHSLAAILAGQTVRSVTGMHYVAIANDGRCLSGARSWLGPIATTSGIVQQYNVRGGRPDPGSWVSFVIAGTACTGARHGPPGLPRHPARELMQFHGEIGAASPHRIDLSAVTVSAAVTLGSTIDEFELDGPLFVPAPAERRVPPEDDRGRGNSRQSLLRRPRSMPRPTERRCRSARSDVRQGTRRDPARRWNKPVHRSGPGSLSPQSARAPVLDAGDASGAAGYPAAGLGSSVPDTAPRTESTVETLSQRRQKTSRVRSSRAPPRRSAGRRIDGVPSTSASPTGYRVGTSGERPGDHRAHRGSIDARSVQSYGRTGTPESSRWTTRAKSPSRPPSRCARGPGTAPGRSLWPPSEQLARAPARARRAETA